MKNRYLDDIGLPGTRQQDGTLDMGDSAAVFFNVEALSPGTFSEDKQGLYFTTAPVRHPDTSKWWGQPDRYSRDQLIPLLCWAALQKKSNDPLVKKVFKSHLKNYLLLAWNTRKNGAMDTPTKFPDITLFEILGLWLRIYRPFWAPMVLWFLDIESLIGSLDWRYHRKDRVTRNHMLVAITQNEVMPSFVSKLSYKINNWQDLISRWEAHCEAVGEYQTADLFNGKLLKEE